MGSSTPEKKERNMEIYKMHKTGLSYAKIGKKFDLRASTVGAIVRRIIKRLKK